MNQHRYREYDLPNAWLRVYPNRRCRQVPKWCPSISVERARSDVARALLLFRAYRRARGAGASHQEACLRLGPSGDARDARQSA